MLVSCVWPCVATLGSVSPAKMFGCLLAKIWSRLVTGCDVVEVSHSDRVWVAVEVAVAS